LIQVVIRGGLPTILARSWFQRPCVQRSGQSAGLIDAVLPAAEIVAGIVREYREARAGLPPVG